MVTWLLFPPTLVLTLSVAAAAMGMGVQLVDRGEQVQWSMRLLSIVLREGVARATFWLMTPLGWGDGEPRHTPDNLREIPVLLLPPLGLNRSAMHFLAVFLQRRGWRWVWPVNLGTRSRDLAEQAADLDRRVRQLRRQTGAEKVDIVAHGLSGVVAAWYIKRLDGAAAVRRLVTIGCPWRGTRLAVFGRGDVARQSLYGAPVLDELLPSGVPTISLWSPDDPMIVPANSAKPEQGADSVLVDSAGHVEMLWSTRVFRATQAALDQATAHSTESPIPEARS